MKTAFRPDNLMLKFFNNQNLDFAGLVKPYIGQMSSVAYRLTGNQQDAEDLLQEFLIKVYPHQKELQHSKSIRAWLTKVLYNTYVDIWRKQKNNPVSALHRLNLSEDEDDSDFYSACASDALCPSTLLEMDEQQQMISRELYLLKNEHRILLVMHDMEGYSLPELSEILGVTLGTLKSRLHRARARLRERITTEHTDKVVA